MARLNSKNGNANPQRFDVKSDIQFIDGSASARIAAPAEIPFGLFTLTTS